LRHGIDSGAVDDEKQHADSEAGDELEVEDLDLDESNAEDVKGGSGSGGWYDNAPPLKQH
jgi:hypothetical protein